jgi:hypothetical protein
MKLHDLDIKQDALYFVPLSGQEEEVGQCHLLGTKQAGFVLARALHSQLEAVSRERNLAVGQDEKQQILYKYITGNQFRQRVTAIIDVFKGFKEDLEKEKRSFKTKWARTEKRIERVMDNMLGMQGDLEGMVSLPSIPTLELEFDGDSEEELEV